MRLRFFDSHMRFKAKTAMNVIVCHLNSAQHSLEYVSDVSVCECIMYKDRCYIVVSLHSNIVSTLYDKQLHACNTEC